jgi:Holliday junction resolvase RusA-like endonuclease
MIEPIRFRVYGYPVAQGRPRFFRRGNHVGTYDPDKSRDWKRTIIAVAIEHKPAELLDGPLDVRMTFLMPRPTSLPRKVVHHIKRPDLDNMVKAAKDAMRGVIYKDDSLIVRLTAEKQYDAAPGLHIEIRCMSTEVAA